MPGIVDDQLAQLAVRSFLIGAGRKGYQHDGDQEIACADLLASIMDLCKRNGWDYTAIQIVAEHIYESVNDAKTQNNFEISFRKAAP